MVDSLLFGNINMLDSSWFFFLLEHFESYSPMLGVSITESLFWLPCPSYRTMRLPSGLNSDTCNWPETFSLIHPFSVCVCAQECILAYVHVLCRCMRGKYNMYSVSWLCFLILLLTVLNFCIIILISGRISPF